MCKCDGKEDTLCGAGNESLCDSLCKCGAHDCVCCGPADELYEFHDYEDLARETAKYPGSDVDILEHSDQQPPMGLLYTALKLSGEAGEFSNKVGKILRDHNGILTSEMREALLDELGDCLWYLAASAYELDSELGIIAARNINKLHSRMKRGVIGGSGDNR